MEARIELATSALSVLRSTTELLHNIEERATEVLTPASFRVAAAILTGWTVRVVETLPPALSICPSYEARGK